MSSDVIARPRVLKADAVRVAPVVHLTGDPDALAEAEERRRRELDDAYHAGLADGRREAEEQGHAAAPRVAAELAALREGLLVAASEQVAADASAIAATAVEIARWVVARELSTDVTGVIARIEAALTELSTSAAVEIAVAPGTVAAVEAWAGESAGVRPDPSLAPGEARLVAGPALADLTFTEAFARAAAALGLDADGAHG